MFGFVNVLGSGLTLLASAAEKELNPGAFVWDPQIRGVLFVGLMVFALMGSTFLLLSTNVGARLGFQIVVTVLAGWMMCLGWLWWINGSGMVGRQPGWKAVELRGGPPAELADPDLVGLPKDPKGNEPLPPGWKRLAESNPTRGEATASADHMLAPGGSSTATKDQEPPPFKPPFSAASDYTQIAAFEKNDAEQATWFKLKTHAWYKAGPAWNPLNWFRRPPNYVVIVVQKTLPKSGLDAVNATPVPDPSQPYYTLTMVRDQGSIRLPPFLIMVGSGMVFAMACTSLHRREKQAMKKKDDVAAGEPAPGKGATAAG